VNPNRRFYYTEGVLHFRSYPRLRAVLRLAVAGKVSASTRNHAKRVLRFLYRLVLGIDLLYLTDVASACSVRPTELAATRGGCAMQRLERGVVCRLDSAAG
jgi:hypothetical protein